MVRVAATARGLVLALLLPAAAAAAEPPPLWFPVGETLVYRIRWGFIPVGKARVSTSWEEQDGRPLVAIRYRVRTNRFFDRIYPVDDYGESIVDPHTFLPEHLLMRITRRRVICDQTVDFDHDRGTAVLTQSCSGARTAFTIESDTRDILSYLYALRRRPAAPGDHWTDRFVGDKGMMEASFEVLERDRIRVSIFGTLPCLVLAPEADFSGMLVDRSRVTAWVTEDARRLAARVLIRAPLAAARLELCQVFGPGDDAYTRAMLERGEDALCRDEAEVEAALANPPPPPAAPRDSSEL